MKIYYLAFVILSIFLAESSFGSPKGDYFSNEKPELSRFKSIKDWLHLGSFYLNHCYIDPNSDPRLVNGYVANLIIVREEIIFLIKKPQSDQYAILDGSMDLKSSIEKAEYFKIEKDGMLYKSWLASKEKSNPSKIEEGKDGRKWSYVDFKISKLNSPYSVEHWFVLPFLGYDKEIKHEAAIILILNEQKITFHYNENGTAFAPVVNDFFWIEIEKPDYRITKKEGAEAVVWEFISKKYPLKNIKE
jgi:hypothetical protein